ncbi:jg15869, partial [Pararge aegeria aegeria]
MRMYEENRGAMIDALVKDLRRSKTEAVLLEVDYLVNDLTNLLNNFEEWAKPEKVVQKARDTYNSGTTKPLEWRKRQLKSLMRMYEENRGAMIDALVKDLRRSKTEAVLLEVDYLVNDLTNLLNNFEEWAKPEK